MRNNSGGAGSREKRQSESLLKEKLDELYLSYDADFIDSDPIQFPHRYRDPRDREVSAFIAAALAYGSVSSIKRNLEKIFAFLGPHPHEVIMTIKPEELLSAFRVFKHRFTTGRHIAWLLLITRNSLKEWGSLKACFLRGYLPDSSSIRDSLVAFVDCLVTGGTRPIYDSPEEARSHGALFLLPSPRSGAACKRLNLFMRWVVRTADSIDLGIWPEVYPWQLVIPLDTHVARLSRYLGLTQRRTADWRMAEEITEALRSLDPVDPLKYDFALARLGILGECITENQQSHCDDCKLAEVCSRAGAIS